ncbi:MAG: bifunctional 2-polyprenyl-6-hydroxyphenol methylase/3-demethylubiquinol 3-O-methyltransferase UbiG [Simkaniaceae bacterium]|nr:bifunctional 2-polyprenyl-6-hydroxyphenol methylase/3-demethylubiquinol 3-O-methyltransferase UbiG [Candidatus Sacchlamyda saccharinae]
METTKNNKLINNAFYDDLGQMWQGSSDHPIALLRAENALRNPWIQQVLTSTYAHPCRVLDVGCGGGYLTNFLATKGHFVSGVDLSEQSLQIAKKYDTSESVEYKRASAYELPFPDNTFDAVCAMDLLEHVENPAQVVKEASRVLKKGGLFFFHTFNRNLLSYFMIIKGVEWCFSNAPRNMHVYPLFIKPEELTTICENHGMQVKEIKGVRPDFSKKAFWKMVLTKQVSEDFRFIFTDSLKTGYSGYASLR